MKLNLIDKACRFILYRILGWKLEGEVPHHLPKAMVIFLPHTSNWDFFYGWLFIRAEKLPITMLGKDQFYFFPFTLMYRYFKVVPIKRGQNANLVEQVVDMYQSRKHLWLAMAPEGTRSYQDHIKSGYYHMTSQSKVPIVIAGPNFEEKKFVLSEPIKVLPTFEEDAQRLLAFAAKMKPKRADQSVV